jgi:hypothetical protein
MTPLCELARKYETDKGGQHYRYGGGDSDTNHNYTPVYHAIFGEDREKIKDVLEIGVHAGSSLRMWKEYFPNAQIIGLDVNQDCMKHKEDRIDVRMADQNNPAQLTQVLGNHQFDFIVDDGSHERSHQIVSMQTLLPLLQDWGWYIIEDLSTGSIESLKSIFDAVPAGFEAEAVQIFGGLGPKVQPHEWLVVVRRKHS